MTKRPPAKDFPQALNVSEMARFYGTSRNTAQTAISRGQLAPTQDGRYDVFAFERAVIDFCPRLAEDTESDAGLWRKFMHHDAARYAWRRRLQERGYDPSA